MSITIRQATPDDATAIYDMIYELAVYEKAPEEVVTTPEEIREALFASGKQNRSADLRGGGQKRWATRCSSPATPPGWTQWYLYGGSVRHPRLSRDRRRKGAAENHRAICCTTSVRASGGGGVLDWNQPAIDFYLSIGAQPQDEWVRYRLTGDALRSLCGVNGSPTGRRQASTCWPRIRLRPRSSAAADRPAPDAHPLRYRCTA